MGTEEERERLEAGIEEQTGMRSEPAARNG
jgi:hypothetical protein